MSHILLLYYQTLCQIRSYICGFVMAVFFKQGLTILPGKNTHNWLYGIKYILQSNQARLFLKLWLF